MTTNLVKYESEEQRDAVLDIFRKYKYKYRNYSGAYHDPMYTNYVQLDSLAEDENYSYTEDENFETLNNEFKFNLCLDIINHVLIDRERIAIELYFGINNNETHTLNEISDVIYLTRETVRKIIKKALHKIRLEIERRENKNTNQDHLNTNVDLDHFVEWKKLRDEAIKLESERKSRIAKFQKEKQAQKKKLLSCKLSCKYDGCNYHGNKYQLINHYLYHHCEVSSTGKRWNKSTRRWDVV